MENACSALTQGGLLVDTQPVSTRPAVLTGGGRLGALDMREWRKVIEAVDEHVAQTIADGLWVSEGEFLFVVIDTFESGAKLVDSVRDWKGTRISRSLTQRVTAAAGPAQVHQEVRMRLLRAR